MKTKMEFKIIQNTKNVYKMCDKRINRGAQNVSVPGNAIIIRNVPGNAH